MNPTEEGYGKGLQEPEGLQILQENPQNQQTQTPGAH